MVHDVDSIISHLPQMKPAVRRRNVAMSSAAAQHTQAHATRCVTYSLLQFTVHVEISLLSLVQIDKLLCI